MPPRTRPIEKMAQAVAKCSTEVTNIPILSSMNANLFQASVYGKCIVADYNSVHKDKCLTEFLKLKDCYVVSRSQLPFVTSANVLEAAAKKK
jgi:hypothetical protein